MFVPPEVPDPIAFSPCESTERARCEVREELAKIRKRSKTGKIKQDSRFAKLREKLTQAPSVDDVERRLRYLEEDETNSPVPTPLNGTKPAP